MSPEYNRTTIRRLLLAAFSAEELARFCQDRPLFRPVCDTFGPGHGLDDMVDELLKYAAARRLFEPLLAEVEAHNPRQYAHFAADLHQAAEAAGPLPAAEAPSRVAIPGRAWPIVALLVLNLGLVLLWGWCLLGDRPVLLNYLQTAMTLIELLLAALALVLVSRQPGAWEDLLRRLGTERRWLYAVLLLTVLNLGLTPFFCTSTRQPTAYMELILDNGPVPQERQFDELKAGIQGELSRVLPNAALSLRVFGLQCGQTRQLVDFAPGNAGDVAEALADVQPVAHADLTEAIRQALDDLLSRGDTQPRVLVVVTWGQEGCGGDLNRAVAAYRQQLGSAVSLNLITLGEVPAVVERPGVIVEEAADAKEVGDALGRINDALEQGEWPSAPRRVTPGPDPDLAP
jgi:hypothetical protein